VRWKARYGLEAVFTLVGDIMGFPLRSLLVCSLLVAAACRTVANIPAPANYATAKQSQASTVSVAHGSTVKTVGLILIGGAAVSGLVAYIVTRPVPVRGCRCDPSGFGDCVGCQ
jgi:hypothetical protein